jgi:cysteine sulfinate desulfinase/cysteine desulfurase-like protein
MKEIYLDHAATTYVRDEVSDAMHSYFQEEYGNTKIQQDVEQLIRHYTEKFFG